MLFLVFFDVYLQSKEFLVGQQRFGRLQLAKNK